MAVHLGAPGASGRYVPAVSPPNAAESFNSLVSASPSLSSTSATTTFAPRATNARAVAAPKPRAAPVMIATLFCKRVSIALICRLLVHYRQPFHYTEYIPATFEL